MMEDADAVSPSAPRLLLHVQPFRSCEDTLEILVIARFSPAHGC